MSAASRSRRRGAEIGSSEAPGDVSLTLLALLRVLAEHVGGLRLERARWTDLVGSARSSR